jgi:hypothetical protein
VSGLTLCDYLLWNWSLNSNHAVLEVVSGLTLPPLLVALLWLLALTFARLLAHGGSRSLDRAEVRRARRRRQRRARSTRARTGSRSAAPQDTPAGEAASAQGSARSGAGSSRGKIAA